MNLNSIRQEIRAIIWVDRQIDHYVHFVDSVESQMDNLTKRLFGFFNLPISRETLWLN